MSFTADKARKLAIEQRPVFDMQVSTVINNIESHIKKAIKQFENSVSVYVDPKLLWSVKSILEKRGFEVITYGFTPKNYTGNIRISW